MVLMQQAQTVFLQATGKLSLLGAAAWAVDATQSPAVRDPDAAEAVTVVFWCLGDAHGHPPFLQQDRYLFAFP